MRRAVVAGGAIVKDGLIGSLLDYGEHSSPPQEFRTPHSLGAAAMPKALPLSSLSRIELVGCLPGQPQFAVTLH
jgi:hypothetical protein